MANSDRITIQGGRINMVNADAKDIGIHLNSNTLFCDVRSFDIINAGIKVQDLGTDNVIGSDGAEDSVRYPTA